MIQRVVTSSPLVPSRRVRVARGSITAAAAREQDRIDQPEGASERDHGENRARWAIAVFRSASPTWSGPGNSSASSRRSIRTWKRPRSSAASTRRGGPAIYFARVKGCRFPMVSNLFGTLERTRFLFRDTLASGAASGRAEDRPVGVLAAARGAIATCRAPCGTCGRSSCAAGPVLAHRDDDRPTAAAAVLAARRRGVHHAAAGLHRGRRPARLAALQPRHVSRAALRQRVSSRIGRSACTTRFIAASACITRRRCGAACRFASTSSSAARRP